MSDESKSVKKVRTPVIPGIRWLYNKLLMMMVAPHLADAGGDTMFATDMASESLMGASNYATALSNGRLFVEVSPWAELTVFRWPNPTYSDQLRYFTQANGDSLKIKPVRLGKDAPSKDWARYGRPVEPCPGLGSSGGAVMGNGKVLWCHDPVWESSRRFTPEGGTVLQTTLEGPAEGGIKMMVEDFIHPKLDLMIRNFSIDGATEKFIYHSTFAPFTARPGEYTRPDPKRAGFAAVYLEDDDCIVHFKPHESPSGRIEEKNQKLKASDIDKTFPEGGVFIAWGFGEASDEHHLGPQRITSNVLNMNNYYEGKVDAALAKRLERGENRITVYIAIAGSSEEAVSIIKGARAAGQKLKSETLDYWRDISETIRIPKDAGENNLRVAKRSILNLIQGQDKEGGCIVASISRQPAYNFDWPRDGAFFDLALDMAGFPQLVDKHHDFYRRTQFKKSFGFAPVRMVNLQAPWWKPSGHWPSNMAADGSQGSVPRFIHFEIDETALLAWDMWRHWKALPDKQAQEYAIRMKPTLESCADALMDYVDLRAGWTRPAFEDDHFPPDATLHGVTSVLAGLASACDAGPEWGIDQARCDKWREAAIALRAGVRARITNPEVINDSGWRGIAWALWPAPIFEDYNETQAEAIKKILAGKIEKKMNKNTPGFVYLGEDIFVLALADRVQGKYRELLVEALQFFTSEVPFPGTDCYGEVTLWVPIDGKKVSQQRTSIPHIWNGITVYLTAMAIYKPEAFDQMKPPVPL